MIYQARAPEPYKMTKTDFEICDDTGIYWLTGASVFINSHGTKILIDPVLSLSATNPSISEIDDILQYVNPPIFASEIQNLDAVLYTHADTDHMGPITVNTLKEIGVTFHGTPYVKDKLIEMGVSEKQIISHDIQDSFCIGDVIIQMTLAYHPWQLDFPEQNLYVYQLSDCCGFKLYTPDGVIWVPGDSRFLPEHLENEDVDLLFMDFEDNNPIHHFGVEKALKIVNHLSKADIIMYHWGTYYAPDKCWFSADPASVRDQIINNSRFIEPHPGERIVLHRKNV